MGNNKKYISTGVRLKAVRLSFFPDMLIKDYADMLGFTYTRYLNWESGLNRPMPEEAEVFCNKFGLTMDFIYRGIETALSNSTMVQLSQSPLLSAQRESTLSPD